MLAQSFLRKGSSFLEREPEQASEGWGGMYEDEGKLDSFPSSSIQFSVKWSDSCDLWIED
jgi:hypothetical protein